MTNEQKNKCHAIIHTATAIAAAGNLVPVPGLGMTADMTAMTTMAISLASVFGRDLTKAVARGMAYAALKRMIMRQPIRYASKEACKFIPWGSAVSAAISAVLVEAVGWQLAGEFEQETLCLEA